MANIPSGVTLKEEKTIKSESEILSSLKKIMEDSFISVKKAAEKSSSQLIDNFVGPMKLITDPLQQLTGIDLVEPLRSLPGKLGGIFSKKNKKENDEVKDYLEKNVQPSKNALKRQGIIGASAVYLAESLKDTPSKSSILGEDSMFGNLSEGLALGGAAGTVQTGITSAMANIDFSKVAGIGLIAGAVVAGVIDGIIAYGKAESWGVSRVAAGIGGFLGGTGEGGDFKSAFKNAGKFAMAGAGIGLLAGGPVGALAGGLAGTALGGILGWIGGKNISQFFQGVGDWFSEQIGNVKELLNENSEEINEVKKTLVGLVSSLFGPILDGMKSVFSGITFRFKNIKDILGIDDKSFWQKAGGIAKEIILGIIEVPYNYVKGGLASLFGDRWNTMGDILGDNEKTLWDKVKGITNEVLKGMIDFPISIISSALLGADSIIKLFLNDEWEMKYEDIKIKAKSWFTIIVNSFVGGITSIFDGWKDSFTGIKDILRDEETTIWDKIKGITKEVFSAIILTPVNYFNGLLKGTEFLTNIEKFLPKIEVGTWFTTIFDSFINGIESVFNGWIESIVNIKDILGDDNLTLWKKIKGITKELFFGIVMTPVNYLNGLLEKTTLFTNIKSVLDEDISFYEKITEVAKSIFDSLIMTPVNFVKNLITGVDNFIIKHLSEEKEEKYELIKTNISSWFSLIFDPFIGGVSNIFKGWTHSFTSIKEILGDDETSTFEKIKDVTKELIFGVINGPINLVSGWMNGLMKNEKFKETKDKMTSWFTNIGESISDWIWNILPDWIQDSLRKIDLGKVGQKTAAGIEISNKILTKLSTGEISRSELEGAANKEFIDEIINATFKFNKTKLEELLNFEPSRKLLADIGIRSQKDIDSLSSIKGEPNSKVDEFRKLLEKTPIQNINDAILYKDGKMIEPHQDDNIVFSKNTPRVTETKSTTAMTTDINKEYFTKKIMDESNKKLDSMITILTTILTTIEKKDMAPSYTEFSTPRNLNFEILR